MENKMTNVIEDIENRIKWEQQLIDRCAEDIKEYTKTCTPENMVMFLPNKIKELEEAIDRRKNYAEQLTILQFIREGN